jgi:hypothetical protein
VRILASTSVSFGPTTVQKPNLAPLETKQITVFEVLYTTLYSFVFVGVDVLTVNVHPLSFLLVLAFKIVNIIMSQNFTVYRSAGM